MDEIFREKKNLIYSWVTIFWFFQKKFNHNKQQTTVSVLNASFLLTINW